MTEIYRQFIKMVKYGSKKTELSNKNTKCFIDFRKRIYAQHEQLGSKIKGNEAQL